MLHLGVPSFTLRAVCYTFSSFPSLSYLTTLLHSFSQDPTTVMRLPVGSVTQKTPRDRWLLLLLIHNQFPNPPGVFSCIPIPHLPSENHLWEERQTFLHFSVTQLPSSWNFQSKRPEHQFWIWQTLFDLSSYNLSTPFQPYTLNCVSSFCLTHNLCSIWWWHMPQKYSIKFIQPT